MSWETLQTLESGSWEEREEEEEGEGGEEEEEVENDKEGDDEWECREERKTVIW